MPLPKRPEPKRVESGNKKGRYLLKDKNGVERDWQRATTFAGKLDNRYGLEGWFKRNVAIGFAADHNLVAKTALLQDPQGEDKAALDDICEEASVLAGSDKKSKTGTLLHELTEMLDLGHEINVPAILQADVDAYRSKLAENKITILPDYIERVVVLDDLEIAGTLDRIIEFEGEWYIADLKTGGDVVRYPHKINLQLALYAHADCLFDWDWEREPMVPVNQERGLIIHLPSGQAQCTLHWFDLKQGWEATKLVRQVDAWQKAKGLVLPFQQGPAPASIFGSDPPPEAPETPQISTDVPCACAECGAPIADKGLLEMSLYRHKTPLCVEHYNGRR